MIKIDKRYTIKFSYAGITQYAEFYEAKGKLHEPRLYVSYFRPEKPIPDISKLEHIDDVLNAIKTFAYCNKAEIYLINGQPLFFKKKTEKLINSIHNRYELIMSQQISSFFRLELMPLLKKNKWKISNSHVGYLVLVEKDKAGNWDNVKEYKKTFEFEYLCHKCMVALNLSDSISLTEQQTTYIYASDKLFNHISDEIMSGEFYIKLD